MDEDRYLAADVEAVKRQVLDGTLRRAAERAVGPLV